MDEGGDGAPHAVVEAHPDELWLVGDRGAVRETDAWPHAGPPEPADHVMVDVGGATWRAGGRRRGSIACAAPPSPLSAAAFQPSHPPRLVPVWSAAAGRWTDLMLLRAQGSSTRAVPVLEHLSSRATAAERAAAVAAVALSWGMRALPPAASEEPTRSVQRWDELDGFAAAPAVRLDARTGAPASVHFPMCPPSFTAKGYEWVPLELAWPDATSTASGRGRRRPPPPPSLVVATLLAALPAAAGLPLDDRHPLASPQQQQLPASRVDRPLDLRFVDDDGGGSVEVRLDEESGWQPWPRWTRDDGFLDEPSSGAGGSVAERRGRRSCRGATAAAPRAAGGAVHVMIAAAVVGADFDLVDASLAASAVAAARQVW